MGNALGMIELSSIARGIEVCDFMLKAAQVDLNRSCTVCPGKYMIIIFGNTGDVKASMNEGEKRSGEYLVDTLFIPNIHAQLIPALSAVTTVPKSQAVGVIEFYSVASAIFAADIAAKAAQITLIEVRIGYAIGGKGFVTLSGEVGAVRAAIAAAEKNSPLFLQSTVIPKPSPKLFETLL